MPIPLFNEQGFLPPGIHACSLEEAATRFGSFQGSDCRPRLWAKFKDYFLEAKSSGLVKFLLLDGSFVTAKADPGDLDLIVALVNVSDFALDFPPFQYNVISQHSVRR